MFRQPCINYEDRLVSGYWPISSIFRPLLDIGFPVSILVSRTDGNQTTLRSQVGMKPKRVTIERTGWEEEELRGRVETKDEMLYGRVEVVCAPVTRPVCRLDPPVLRWYGTQSSFGERRLRGRETGSTAVDD